MVPKLLKFALQFLFSSHQFLYLVMLLPLCLVHFCHEHSLCLIYLHLCLFVKIELKSPEKAYIIFGIWLIFL